MSLAEARRREGACPHAPHRDRAPSRPQRGRTGSLPVQDCIFSPQRTQSSQREGRNLLRPHCSRTGSLPVQGRATRGYDIRHPTASTRTRRSASLPFSSPHCKGDNQDNRIEPLCCFMLSFHILSLLFSLLKSKDDPQRGQGRRPHRKVPQRSVETVQLFNKLKSHSGVSLI